MGPDVGYKGVLSSALGKRTVHFLWLIQGGSWRHMGKIQEPSTQTGGWKGEVMA